MLSGWLLVAIFYAKWYRNTIKVKKIHTLSASAFRSSLGRSAYFSASWTRSIAFSFSRDHLLARSVYVTFGSARVASWTREFYRVSFSFSPPIHSPVLSARAVRVGVRVRDERGLRDPWQSPPPTVNVSGTQSDPRRLLTLRFKCRRASSIDVVSPRRRSDSPNSRKHHR